MAVTAEALATLGKLCRLAALDLDAVIAEMDVAFDD